MTTSRSARLLVCWGTLAAFSTILGGCPPPPAPDAQDEHPHDSAGGTDDGHDEHVDEVRLSSQDMAAFGIEIDTATGGTITLTRDLPGEITFNPDRVAHVQPRVSGVVREVHHGLGDVVDAGDVLAVLDSRELAQATTGYLAAQAKHELAQANFAREERLWEDQISSERSYLEAAQVLQNARIDAKRAERELHALGLSEQNITALADLSDEQLTRYQLTAPIGGMITDRHLVRGEVIHAETDEPPFVIADLTSVWVNLTVYARDQSSIRQGRLVVIRGIDINLEAEGPIDFISPTMDEATRTATARIVIDNADRRWRPGLFVTGAVHIDDVEAAVVVPLTALHALDDRTVIFVEVESGAFTARSVTVGATDGTRAAIVDGLDPGQRYVANGGFALKSELNKAALEHAGHAH